MRILLVDDNEAVRRGIRSLLSSSPDVSVCGEAADGVEAVERARELRPDLIVMDVTMPRMNGLDATRRIRKELPEIRIIIISQNDPSMVRRQAVAVQAHAFVEKVELSRDLFPAISAAMSSHDGHNGTHDGAAAAPAHVASPLIENWLFGGGSLGQLIRAHDWSNTPLGSIERWPHSLRSSVNLMLNSQHPMWIGWGPDKIFLYNDAYISVLGLAKHPWALGRPAQEVWSEIWDICGPLAEKVFRNGEPSYVDNVRLFMMRGDRLEETYYSFSYSPIYDESGKVTGLFCPSAETTANVLHARRLQTLSELSAKALAERSIQASCASSLRTLAKNPDDIPFALLYLVDQNENHAHLEGASRIDETDARIRPAKISLDAAPAAPLAQDSVWPVAQVVASSRPETISLANLASLPRGAADLPPTQALLLPLTARSQVRPLGVLIAGVNPTRPLDAEYRTFFTLIADQLSAAIQNARFAEEEKQRNEALAEVDRAKTAFFSNVSHEFRTPLTLMLGPLQDLLSRSQSHLSQTAKEQLELVNRNGARLLRLVNTLLDFSRIEAGRAQAIFEATDLAAFTADLASVFRSATERAGLGLEVDCPPLGEPVYVDREMWEKVVLNLISNAFKFTFEGGISISVRRSGRTAELRVSDTGVGIPAAEMPRLFERFHRVPNTRSRTYEGSGIGLALVHELVDLHRGKMRVESAIGEGSTFIVSIPLGQDHLPADRVGGSRNATSTAIGPLPFVEEALRWLPDAKAANAEELPPRDEALPAVPPVAGAPSGARQRIIVADDNSDMREYIARLLSSRYEIEAVADGQAALESARRRPPDLILSDVMMPRLDGIELIRAVRSDSSLGDTPVILLSARAGEESRVEGVEAGADDYLVKPFSARELLARVESHLKLRNVRAQGRIKDQQLAAIVDSSDDAIISKDLNGYITSWNSGAERVFGYSEKEAIGKHITLLIPEDRFDEETTIITRIRRGERINHFDTVRRRKDGRLIHISLTVSPVRDSSGTVVGASKIARDVTERKRAEERERQIAAEIVAAKAKFSAVFEQTTQFAGIMTRDGTLVEINRLSLDVCGYKSEEVLGKYFWETAWWTRFPESREKIRAATPLAAKGIPFTETLRYSWADGSERIVDFQLFPIRNEYGEVIYLHPTGVDITETIRVEENYRRLAESLDAEVRVRTGELEKRNAEVLRQSDLLRDLSQRLLQAQDDERRRIARELHDSSGQTLTALGITLGRISQHAPELDGVVVKDTEEGLALVQQLSQEIRTMSYLLHPPLLDEAGIEGALQWYVDGFSQRSGITVELEIPQNFGRLSPDIELAIFRIVQEALTNIHRHSGSKTGVIRIARSATEVSIEVQDHGKGMSADKLHEIRSGGAGVGMRGMRERVHQLRGRTTLHSDSSGTKLSVVFPIDEAGITDASQPAGLRAQNE